MWTNKIDVAIRGASVAILATTLLTACARPAPLPQAEPPPPAAPTAVDAPQPAEPVPAPAPAPAAPKPPPSTDPVVASGPALETMSAATPSAKMSVAVDLRYSFETPALPNQPVILHLAAVPRAAGTNLSLSVKEVAGVQLAAGPLNVHKANGSEVYRRQLSVTRGTSAPSQLRVLVTMDYASGSGFGFFSIPLDGRTNPQKQDSVKQP
jgi:hypothetical protein